MTSTRLAAIYVQVKLGSLQLFLLHFPLHTWYITVIVS